MYYLGTYRGLMSVAGDGLLEVYQENISKLLTGRKLPEAVCRKTSRSHKGHFVSANTRKKYLILTKENQAVC